MTTIDEEKESSRARQRRYYARHREALLVRKREPRRTSWRKNYYSDIDVARAKARAATKRYRENNTVSYLLSLARRRARLRGLEFNLEVGDIFIPPICPLLEVPIEKSGNNRPSIDRINPNLGYVRGNVMVVSWRANQLKNNATAEELMMIALNMKKFGT